MRNEVSTLKFYINRFGRFIILYAVVCVSCKLGYLSYRRNLLVQSTSVRRPNDHQWQNKGYNSMSATPPVAITTTDTDDGAMNCDDRQPVQ